MTAVGTGTARVSQVLACGGGLAVVAAPLLGYRAEWIALGPAFLLLLAGFLVVTGTLLTSLAAVVFKRRRSPAGRRAVPALLVAAIVCLVPLWSIVTGLGAPPIHDITTDTEDPPEFVAVVPLNIPNRTVYEGETIAARQRDTYPDLQPVILDVPPARAFDAALATVDEMGWELVSADAGAGRIEATDTTFWFGFKDDVVIRVQAAANGSRVDVRSLSRVGGGDAGANAARIRRYVTALTGQ